MYRHRWRPNPNRKRNRTQRSPSMHTTRARCPIGVAEDVCESTVEVLGRQAAGSSGHLTDRGTNLRGIAEHSRCGDTRDRTIRLDKETQRQHRGRGQRPSYITGIDERRISDAQTGQQPEGSDRVVLHVDPHHTDRIGLVRVRIERRDLFPAWPAPRRPQIDQGRLPAQRGCQIDRCRRSQAPHRGATQGRLSGWRRSGSRARPQALSACKAGLGSIHESGCTRRHTRFRRLGPGRGRLRPDRHEQRPDHDYGNDQPSRRRPHG